jgi:hypothetical protein
MPHTGGVTADAELKRLLRELEPELYAEPYVFVQLAGLPAPDLEDAFAIIREDEGVTAVLTREAAAAAGHAYDFVAARITLRVDSTLEGVGLTAAFSDKLAAAGISCNVIAGVAHDHLFVPFERGAEALEALRALSSELPE